MVFRATENGSPFLCLSKILDERDGQITMFLAFSLLPICGPSLRFAHFRQDKATSWPRDRCTCPRRKPNHYIFKEAPDKFTDN